MNTGTREPSSAMYKVTNYIDQEVEAENGIVQIKFNPVTTDLFRNSKWTTLDNFTFNDGTTNLPADLPPPIALLEDTGFNLPFLIGTPIGAVLFLGVFIFLFYEHKRKQNDSVWHVKKEELKFPEPPQVIGQGSFGLVLLAEYRGTQVAVKRVIPPSTKRGSGGDAPTMMTASGVNMMKGDHSESERAGGDSKIAVTAGGSNNVGMRSGSLGTTSRVGGGSSSGNTGMTSSIGNKSKMGGGFISGTVSMFQGAKGQSTDSTLRRRLKAEFIEEMRYLSKLRHPCVTTVMGAVIDRGEEPMLIMEASRRKKKVTAVWHMCFTYFMYRDTMIYTLTLTYAFFACKQYMDHGSLYDLLHNETIVIEGELLLPILRDVSQGVRFLHSANPQVIHGDLKAQNILVDNRFRAKVR
jgi:Protein kinase domain